MTAGRFGKASVVAIVAAGALALGACGLPSVEFLRAPGSRQWIIPVVNDSNRPVLVAVARDESPMGQLVGSAEPGVVPPFSNIDVVFTVPSGFGWAIFVNPGANVGALITSGDVPAGRSGRLPLQIAVDRNGNPSVSAPAEPGWFGN